MDSQAEITEAEDEAVIGIETPGFWGLIALPSRCIVRSNFATIHKTRVSVGYFMRFDSIAEPGVALPLASGAGCANSTIIKQLKPPALFEPLRSNLPYEETRQYVVRVTGYGKQFVGAPAAPATAMQ